MIRMGAARFSGAEDLVPGFSKLAPTRAELEAAAAKAPAPSGGRGGRGGRGSPALAGNEWHTVQVILDADVLNVSLNGNGRPGLGIDINEEIGEIPHYRGPQWWRLWHRPHH